MLVVAFVLRIDMLRTIRRLSLPSALQISTSKDVVYRSIAGEDLPCAAAFRVDPGRPTSSEYK